MSVLDGSKFKPTLFVGLGGHGGKIVNLLARKLRRHSHWPRIEPMTHFVAIDTNKDDLDKLEHVPLECHFLVSAFDRQSYIQRKRGLREIPEDRLVTQWAGNSYQFRDSQGAGAGQIRMESRLGVYYNLEDDRAGIRRKIDQLLQQSTRIGNPWRDNEDRVVRVVVYGSVAGGTGSGSFLPMAYLLRQMVVDQGWGRPSVEGVLTLPTAFLEKVKPELHDDILANGYAALKETEYLARQLSYEGGMSEVEFHFDPGTRNPERTRVTGRPFDIAYLVDRPTQVSIERYENAIADASYLQIFSPILGAQKGEYDNYEKRQKSLANGEFSVHWGAFGSSILHFPRTDVLRYAALRYVARALREYLCFGGDDPEFRVPYGDPAFERLSDDEKAKRIDDAFVRYVDSMAAIERNANEKGVFSAVAELRGRDNKDLRVALTERLKDVYGRLDALIEISDIEAMSINPGNPSMSRALDGLRREYAASLARVNAELDVQRTALRQGRFLGELFRAFDVSPITQRLLLLRAFREPFLVPFDDPSEGELLRPEAGNVPSIDDANVQQNIGRMNQELQRTATQGVLDKLRDRDNQAFQTAKRRAIGVYDELAQDLRTELRRVFWRGFERELRQVAGTLLATFRRTAEIADGAARQAEHETEDFRRDPGRDPDSDVAQYYLDAETLRDDRRAERLWHWLYAHLLDKGAYFVPADIYAQVSAAFAPERDNEGRLKARDAAEVVRAVRDSLLTSARATYQKAFTDLQLDLSRTLSLEQRYIALLDGGANLRELVNTGKLEAAIDAVPLERVRRGVEDKLQRLWSECAILANISEHEGDGVSCARVRFVGLAPRFQTDEQDSLGTLFKRVTGGVEAVEGWNDVDAVVVYRALLGIPVYWFTNVNGALEHAYKAVSQSAQRSYPLHIEAAWEANAGHGLPNLDPVEIRRAREREALAQTEKEAALGRALRIREFTLAAFAGSIIDTGSGYAWSAAGTSQALGRDRAAAFAGFFELSTAVRELLLQPGLDAWGARNGERPARAKLLAELQAHDARLGTLLLRATAEQRDSEARFVTEEVAVVREMIRGILGQT